MKQASNNLNTRCIYITSMHHMEQKIVVLYYVDDFVYEFIYEAVRKLFLDTIGKRFNMNFLGFSHFLCK